MNLWNSFFHCVVSKDAPVFLIMRIEDDFTECENDVQIPGRVAIVTGATSGLGLEAARNFARRGARVIIASRNPKTLAEAREDIIQSTGNENVVAKQMDFASLKSIRNFASEMYLTEPRLHILVNNIGAVGLEEKLTEDNLHPMMQVNYFGTFLLTYLLFPLLKASAPSRIVNVASLALILGRVELDHLNDLGRHPNFLNYGNAKLAGILFTREMNERIEGSGVNIYSMDPGLVKTELFKHYNESSWGSILTTALFIFGRHPSRVAEMPVFLSVDPRVEHKSGKHYRDCVEFFTSWDAEDKVLRTRLWEVSKKYVGITPEEDWENW